MKDINLKVKKKEIAKNENTNQLNLRLSDSDKLILEKKAKQANMSKNEFIRTLIKVAEIDEIDD